MIISNAHNCTAYKIQTRKDKNKNRDSEERI